MSRQEEQEQAMQELGWLSVAAAAARLKVAVATVYRQIASGEIDSKKVVGRTYVKELDVTRLAGPLADGTQQGETAPTK